MNNKAKKIINTTITLFLDIGAKKVTMDDIAKHANSSKVTIYKYFSDKDTLYFEVGKYIYQKYTQQLKSIVISEDTTISRMNSYLSVICDFTDMGYFTLSKELAQYNSDLNKEYDAYLLTYRDTMLQLIDEGIQQDLIKSGLDRTLIFSYIDMGVEYYQNNSLYRYKINNDKDFQEKFMSFYIGNIFKNN